MYFEAAQVQRKIILVDGVVGGGGGEGGPAAEYLRANGGGQARFAALFARRESSNRCDPRHSDKICKTHLLTL